MHMLTLSTSPLGLACLVFCFEDRRHPSHSWNMEAKMGQLIDIPWASPGTSRYIHSGDLTWPQNHASYGTYQERWGFPSLCSSTSGQKDAKGTPFTVEKTAFFHAAINGTMTLHLWWLLPTVTLFCCITLAHGTSRTTLWHGWYGFSIGQHWGCPTTRGSFSGSRIGKRSDAACQHVAHGKLESWMFDGRHE